MMDPSKKFCAVHGEYQTTTFRQDCPRCPVDRRRDVLEEAKRLRDFVLRAELEEAVVLRAELDEAVVLRAELEEAIVLRAELERSRTTVQTSSAPESTLAVPCLHAEVDVIVVIGEGMSHWCQRCGALSIRVSDGWVTKLPNVQGGGTTFSHYTEEEQTHEAVEGRR
jgi:predicted  nucleic acid-binding Zn-ribbon protein